MAHAQKPDFVFRWNVRVHLNRLGRQFSRLLEDEVCTSAVVMLDTPCSEVVWRVTGYPLHSPVSPSIPHPCVTMCHHISTGLYNQGKKTNQPCLHSVRVESYRRRRAHSNPRTCFINPKWGYTALQLRNCELCGCHGNVGPTDLYRTGLANIFDTACPKFL